MRVPIYQVDAFTRVPFRGNPAAICPLDAWLPDELMQAIAAENNLSETAYFVPRPDGELDLRWFTPAVEVDLCGHATLASGFVVLELLEPERDSVAFHTRSGRLTVTKRDGLLEMSLPSHRPSPATVDSAIAQALGATPIEQLEAAKTAVCVLDSSEAVRALEPDFRALDKAASWACVTAPGTGVDADVDFVSRFFAPGAGIDEDPVTGSAHCYLTPYWAARLGKTELRARQVSAREGEITCRLVGDRVQLLGGAVLVLEGQLLLPHP